MERLYPSPFNLTKNILETTKRVEELLHNERYETRFESDDDVYVDAVEPKIGRAFYNLMVNAVNYSGDSHGDGLGPLRRQENYRLA